MIAKIMAVLALCLSGSLAAAMAPNELEKAIQFPVEKYKLKNGLTVILSPDNTIPAVSVQQWFRVGSKDEVPGRTGLAHFFEHMMFKGTKKYPKDTWGAFLNGKGAEMNAFTSNDYTGFYINAPSEHLPLLLDIESDRMRNLSLNPDDVNSEREVVKEERRMRYDDNIEGGIQEKMSSLMYESLPYRWLPIGSMTDLNAASMADLHKFYKTFYSPNNAVLIVAGSFNSGEAKAWIDKSYGGIPSEEIQRPPSRPEKPQKKERRAVIEREAQAPTVAVGYILPDLTSTDHYALDLLAIVLGQGESSRLYKQMVYKNEMALNASSSSWGQTLAGEFEIQSTLKSKTDPEKGLLMIDLEVKRLGEAPLPQKELDKARNIFMKNYVDGLKKISGRAHMLAMYEILFGDYSRIFSDLKQYQKVKPSDVMRVASTYLNPRHRNIVIVNPKKSGGAN